MKNTTFRITTILLFSAFSITATSQAKKLDNKSKSIREIWLKYRESWESDLNFQTMRMLTGRNIQGVRYSSYTGNWEYSYKENGYEKTEILDFNNIQIYSEAGRFISKKDKKSDRYRFINFMLDSLSKEVKEKVVCYLSRRVDETTDSYIVVFKRKGKFADFKEVTFFLLEVRFSDDNF